MISFWRIFWLELVGFVRSKTLAMLLVASEAWMLGFQHFIRGDGTAEGVRELYIHYSLGGVFVLLVVSLLASAAGSVARERAAKRLQLTMVRPVRFVSIVLGKALAHVVAGALVLAIACVTLAFKTDVSVSCNHVLSPVLPSPREEAAAMYEEYMKDPETPAQVKRAKKSVVMRLLTQRAVDHYQTIPTNDTVTWKFDLDRAGEVGDSLAVRMRFTNQFEMRQFVLGEFVTDGFSAAVSNVTQAVLTIPLKKAVAVPEKRSVLAFANRGKSALMLRPRRDINLLIPGDEFWRNLVRAYLELVAILALVVSFGLFLSAGLGQPVALFVAFAVLIVGEMSPSVVEQYPDELETKRLDRIGLYITRFAASVTRPVSASSPLEALAKDECVEMRDVLRLAVANLAVVPVLLALMAAFIMPRKQTDD